MTPYGKVTADILAALTDLGPMTVAELSRHTGHSQGVVGGVIRRLGKSGPNTPKRVYVAAYTRDDEKLRDYRRRIYAVGDKADAKAPPPKTRNHIARDHKRKVTALRRTNFVFHLGGIFDVK